MFLCFLRVRKYSTLYLPLQPIWHFLSAGVPHPTRMRCSLEIRLICVTSVLSNKETPCSYQQVRKGQAVMFIYILIVMVLAELCQSNNRTMVSHKSSFWREYVFILTVFNGQIKSVDQILLLFSRMDSCCVDSCGLPCLWRKLLA